MGFKFRKSFNLGGGFRVNLSKSGIGYSWGGKGFRITHTSKGKIKARYSLPIKGLSYTKTLNSKQKQYKKITHKANQVNYNKPTVSDNNNYYDTQEIKNANVDTLKSDGLEDMLFAANRSLKLWTINKAFFITSLVFGLLNPIFWIIAIINIICGIYLRKNAIINMEYSFEDNQADEVNARMEPLIKITQSHKFWWISQTSKVIEKKYAAGASNIIKRNNCTASTKAPFPFKTNSSVVTFSSGNETLIFLPDKLFIIQNNKIGALNYSDVVTSIHNQRFIETQTVPNDAQIVDYTWKYVNKSGGPDKRFQNNTKIPVCLYGEIEIRSPIGINTDIMFSKTIQ